MSINLKNFCSVEWLIVDESDKLFETGIRGFRDQLAVIYQACDSSNIKRAMFSATYTTEVAKWSRKNLKDLVLVTIGHRYNYLEYYTCFFSNRSPNAYFIATGIQP